MPVERLQRRMVSNRSLQVLASLLSILSTGYSIKLKNNITNPLQGPFLRQ